MLIATSEFSSPFLAVLRERGLINQCTDLAGLDAALSSEGSKTAYVGFDATADSLHVGHLVSLMAMRHFAACGHKVIALLGGATTMVGDPSFRNATRPMLSPEEIERNVEGIRTNISAVMAGLEDHVSFVNNGNWLSNVGMIDFMRTVGVHFTVARMLSMESVSGRLDAGKPLSMLEFSYMMLQAADFRELARRHGCILQMGGSDQWGNIVNGIELARRADGAALFGLTTPLLTTANGQKMGKTANGAIWLSPERLHPSDFWQFWRNVDDADVCRFLCLFTEISVKEAMQLTSGSGAELNEAKRILASAVTKLVHGEEAAKEAERRAVGLFNGKDALPTHEIVASDGQSGLLDLLVSIGFAKTKGEARRLIRGGGVKLDDEVVRDETLMVRSWPAAVVVGKKRRALVTVS